MRSWFVAVVCCALSCSTAKAATNDYVLNKSYEHVVTEMTLNGEQIHKRLNTKVLEAGKKKNSLFYSARNGFYVGQSRTNVVETKTPDGFIEATVHNKVLFREGQMRIEVEMEPNDYLNSYSMVIVFEPSGNQTKVHSFMDFELRRPKYRIFENAHKRVYLRKLEKIIREIVGDPLPEEEDE